MNTYPEYLIGPLDVGSMVGSCAAELRRSNQWVDVNDLLQVGWLWALEHEAYIAEQLEKYTEGTAAHYVRKRISRAMTSFLRSEIASFNGYDPSDNVHYPVSLDRESITARCIVALATGETDQPQGSRSEGKSNVDLAEAANNWLVALVDVGKGWALLEEHERKLLAEHFAEERSTIQLGDFYEVTELTVASRLRRALRRLVYPLGGER